MAVAAALTWWVAAGRCVTAVRGRGSPRAAPHETIDAAAEGRIAAFCGDCHALPRPESFPRDRWHREVRLGYEYYARSGRNDLDPPPIAQTVEYYRARAPQRLVFGQPAESPTPLGVSFRVESVDWDRGASVPAATSHIRWCRLEPRNPHVLLVCDMRDGSITALDPRSEPRRPRLLARLEHPCHVEPCDLDNSGQIGLVVADLGSFAAVDHDRGRIVWLRPNGGRSRFEPVVLASGLGRVADARPMDADGDGDLDLIVAEFGHYRTGGIWLLRNTAPAGRPPEFVPERLDARTGTIHVPTGDWDQDSRPDFLALVSNESECLDAFLNLGAGKFRRRLLWQAADLTFGSSGIEPVDLDGDGDLDVLLTNGDSFDNLYANPWHGVQWLENLGQLRFDCHRLADLPGAYRALASDLDGDGDLDIVAVTWLPQQVLPAELRQAPLASVVCLEQVGPGRFVHHTLETGLPHHPTLELADFDGDGDVDFAVGFNAGLDGSAGPAMPRVAIWWNQPRGQQSGVLGPSGRPAAKPAGRSGH